MRQELIEVMAKAIYEAMQHPPNGWKAQWNDGAAAALDALLDYLDTEFDFGERRPATDLWAVLREDD